jgi:hypothetical protein
MTKQLSPPACESHASSDGINRVQKWFHYFVDVKFIPSILALLVAGYAVVVNRADIDITFNKEGATLVTRGSKIQKAIILLPASKIWLNTGLQFSSGQSATITASGAVNLSIHRLVEAAQDHKRPRLGWLGPEGGSHPYPTDLDNARSKYLILPDPANYGTVLACIVPENERSPGKEYPRPNGVIQIGKCGNIKAKVNGTLWLTVNDVVLDDKSRDAYVPPQSVLDEAYRKKVTVAQKAMEWKDIQNRRYFEAFFDDNIGEFLIQVDLTK